MRMIFTCEHDGPFNKVNQRLHYETMSETLTEVIEDFELFLKGCGFNFDGHLDIISMKDFYGELTPEEHLSVPEYYDDIIGRHEVDHAD